MNNYEQICEWHPEDIEDAVNGYGPKVFQKLLKRFIKVNFGYFSRDSLARVLGIQPDLIANTLGTNNILHTVIVLQPLSQAEPESIKFTSGII